VGTDTARGGQILGSILAPVPDNPASLARYGRLIVRRVRRLNPKAAAQGQGELFATYRYHAVFTDSPFGLTQAESDHRGHAVIEQVYSRPDRRPPGPPALGLVPRPRRLAAAGHHRARAEPSAGHARLHPTRRGPRRHHPPRADPDRRATRPQRTRPDHLAPARSMALASSLARRVRGYPPRAPSPGCLTPCCAADRSTPLIPAPPGPTTDHSGQAGREASSSHAPAPSRRHTKINNMAENDHSNSRGGFRLRVRWN
jgi:hypothetical protein